MGPMFVHLRLHTEFSVADGTCRIDDVVAAAKADGQAALAITDLNNLFGAVKFYSACRQQGIKPLLGAEVALIGPDEEWGSETSKIVLLVQNTTGYLNLCDLLTKLWTQSPEKTHNAIDWRWLQPERTEGLLALSGAQQGPVGQLLLAGNPARARALAEKFSQLFPNRFYMSPCPPEASKCQEHACREVASQEPQSPVRFWLPFPQIAAALWLIRPPTLPA